MHIYDKMPGQNKAGKLRGWFLGYLDEKLSFDERVLRRSFNGMIGFMFDDQHFVHFKRIDIPEIAPVEGKTILQAKFRQNYHNNIKLHDDYDYHQLEMEFPDLEQSQTHPNLDDLYIICGGYIRAEGYIVGFHLIEQDGEEVINSLEIPLVSERKTVNEVEIPITEFKPKISRKDDSV